MCSELLCTIGYIFQTTIGYILKQSILNTKIYRYCTFSQILIVHYDFILNKLPEVDAEFVTDCNDLSLVCRSLVCKNKNKVDEIAMSATSSLVLETKTNLQLRIKV